MAAGLPLKTSFADGNVLPASDLNDITNTLQLTGTYPDQLAPLASDAIRRPIPFATSTGSVAGTALGANGTSGTVAVAFSTASRFTQAPIVIANGYSNGYNATAVSATSTSGFSYRVINPTASAQASLNVTFIAIQMVSTSGSNS